MGTPIGCKRTIPQIPLRRVKRINKMSDMAKIEMAIWEAVKKERMAALQEKYRYVPCELCLGATNTSSELWVPEAHHLDGNRRHNLSSNCRILHRVCNQRIEDKNIKDVPSLL